MGKANPNKTFNPASDIPDLAGKVVLITGANTGVGASTVKHLARRGARVYMGARSADKAKAAIARLQEEGLGPGNGEVIWFKLDMSDCRDVKEAGERFMKLEQRLDVLVHNAAVLMEPYKKTHDGLSDIVMVNHIGPFLLTRTLLPLLTATSKQSNADVRIVVVASEGHRMVPATATFDSIDALNNEFKSAMIPAFTRYTYTKLCNVLWARELQSRLTADNTDISVVTLHPGAVNSFSDRLPFPKFTPRFVFTASAWVIELFFKTNDQGAYNSAFAAGSPQVKAEPEKFKGVYLQDTGLPMDVSKVAQDPTNSEALWKVTEEFLKGINV